MNQKGKPAIVSGKISEEKIYLVRRKEVMIDSDLAEMEKWKSQTVMSNSKMMELMKLRSLSDGMALAFTIPCNPKDTEIEPRFSYKLSHIAICNNSIMDAQIQIMKPQDVIILLKIVTRKEKPWPQLTLADELFISQSEISASIAHSKYADLLHFTGYVSGQPFQGQSYRR